VQDEVKMSLAKEMGPAEWSLIEPHYDRGVLVHVDKSLDFLDVAVRIAKDDADFIKQQMTLLKIKKVDPDNVEDIKQSAKVFTCVVVAPFVLIQP
jgi:hypothetical protein